MFTARSFSRTGLCFWNLSLCVQLEVSLEQVCVPGDGLCVQIEVSLEQVCVSVTGLCVQLEVLSNRSVFLDLIFVRSSSRTGLCFRNWSLCTARSSLEQV